MVMTIAVFVVGILLVACCLWAGTKVLRIDGTFSAMLIVAASSSLLGLIPAVGLVPATIAMYVLLLKLTDADFFPGAVCLVILANVFRFALGLIVGSLFLSAQNISGLQ